MSDDLVLALAQVNPTVGDTERNTGVVLDAWRRAQEQGADVVVLSEMVVTGYPLEDLVLKPALARMAERAVAEIAAKTADGPALIVGAPYTEGGRLLNGAFLLQGGRVVARQAKHLLPNYGVFDEKRTFELGQVPGPMSLELPGGRSFRLGVMVCEDMWQPDVAEALAETGAEILIAINGSPFEDGKDEVRLQLALARVAETGLPLVYLNMVGGQDDLVFDGRSFALDADRRLVAKAAAFEEGLTLSRWRRGPFGPLEALKPYPIVKPLDDHALTWQAMVVGLRDYVNKNGFPGVCLGLSGGLDSALSAAVAVDALGPDRVHAVMMPSRYTVRDSLDDAAACAESLGIRLDEVGIEPAVRAFDEMLAPIFGDRPPGLAEENIQSRVRGLIMMAISNKLGPMVLTTGNKSEVAVGYATLYGDMCGGYSVLKDVYKTRAFNLARYRNQHHLPGWLGPAGRVIPENTIAKPPTAELREDQRDEDSLPAYPILDRMLEGLVEGDLTPEDLGAQGLDVDETRRVAGLLDLAEYKRRQSAPGVKLTPRAFGRDRRYPITNRFRKQQPLPPGDGEQAAE